MIPLRSARSDVTVGLWKTHCWICSCARPSIPPKRILTALKWFQRGTQVTNDAGSFPPAGKSPLSVEEQEALADSLISNLGGKVDEGVQAAWESEIGKRIAELDSGKAKTTPWGEVRRRNLAKFPHAH